MTSAAVRAAPADDDLFTEMTAASAGLEDAWIGCTHYRATPVTEVRDGDLVLPPGWGSPCRAILMLDPADLVDLGKCFDEPAAEKLDDRHVRLYWDVTDRSNPPVAAWTVFGRDEKVWVTR